MAEEHQTRQRHRIGNCESTGRSTRWVRKQQAYRFPTRQQGTAGRAETFEGNALKKAQAYVAQTGMASLADDTGLCVDALGGAPGVRSARFGGYAGGDAAERYRANNAKLLEQLARVPAGERGAEFRTALCLLVPGGEPVVVHGIVRGRILEVPRGGHGFGYDPLFEVAELGKTLAELTTEEKNRISHRARAFAALRPHLERLSRG